MTRDITFTPNEHSTWLRQQIAPCVVSFGCTVHDSTPPRAWAGSCFFLKINDHPVLCTAAHVIDEIQERIDAGVKLSDWYINDVFTKSPSDPVYPFDVMKQERLRLRDDELGLDYCIIYIDWLTAENMERSGVRAIMRAQVGDPEKAEQWVLTGFPASFTTLQGNNITQCHMFLSVTPITRPDNWPSDKSKHALFGKLNTAEHAVFNDVNIGGMSGGPIFGLYTDDAGTLEIRLVAVQSGWSETSRIITACPVGDFLDAVQRLIDRVDDFGSTG